MPTDEILAARRWTTPDPGDDATCADYEPTRQRTAHTQTDR
ncbi:MAG: hypothetical protein ABEJ73_06750 [Haloplanus sp.]